MKKTRLLILVVTTMTLARAAVPAQAAMESFIADYGSASAPLVVADAAYPGFTDFPTTIDLPKFNPSLGILTDIVLKLSSTDIVGSEVYNATCLSQPYSGAFADNVTVNVAGPDSVATSATLSAGTFSGTVAANSLAHVGTPSVTTASGMTDVPATDYGHYTGSGQVFINLFASSPSGTFGGSGPQNVYFGGYADSYGTVELDYIYTAVPEPGTWCAGMTALGFGLVKLARRVRRLAS